MMLAATANLTLAAAGTGNSWLASLVVIVSVFAVMMGLVTYMVLLERKVAAWVQDRLGPNRCGPLGLIQPLADAVKLFFKEEVAPIRADKWVFILAPAWIMIPALIAIAVVPLGGRIAIGGSTVDLQIAAPDVGVLYVLAVGGLGVYGVVLGGWASNSKYSFLGGLRSTAQLLSYEVPLGLSLLSVVLVAGNLRLEAILDPQTGFWFGGVLPRWYIFTQPFAFLIFLTCLMAESNRLPFDLPEAEQELVGGYHTEYSSMKFGLFFMAEYAHMLTASAVAVVLFLGGWSFWGLSADQTAWYWALAKLAVFLGKIGLLIWLYMQIRWTLPRFRFDQLMRLAWKGLVPASLGLLMVNGLLLYLGDRVHVPAVAYTAGNVAVFVVMMLLNGLARAPITGRQRALGAVAEEGRT